MTKLGAGGTAQGKTLWLLLAYLLFVIYGSLVPLHFRPRPFIEALAAFAATPFLDLGIGSRADWVANLLLFIPITFLATQLTAGLRNAFARLLTHVMIVVGATALAVGIEFTQLFFPSRTVSQNDILAEGIGGLIGMLLGVVLGPRFRAWLDALSRSETSKDKSTRLLHIYLALLLLFNILPLDLTISPVEIFHKWREGKVVLVPFAKSPSALSDFIYQTITDIAIWIPAGLLWARSPHRFTVLQIGGLGLLAALAIEVLQLFVYSRLTDVTDVIFGTVGVTLGGLLAGFSPASGAAGRQTAWSWLAVWAAWLCTMVAIFWFPFDFTPQYFTWQRVAEAFSRTPFSTYYYTSEYHAINEALRKLGFFFPAGFLVGIAFRHRDRNPPGGLFVWTAIFAALAAAVEAGQLLLPGKVADLTDAFLETCGSIAGLQSARWIFSERRLRKLPDTASPPVPQPKAALPSPPPRTLTHHALAIPVLAVAGFTVAKLPGIPYNVRDLIPSGLEGILAALGLAAAIYLVANSPFLLLSGKSRQRLVLFPLLLPLQGIIIWILLRIGVPLESIHDIVGTPILGWPWEWEMFLRFLALHQAIATQMIGAVLLVATICRPSLFASFVYWFIVSLLFAWPLHLVVVEWAATDNLTELMRNNAAFASSSLLATGYFFTCLSGSALSAAFAIPARRRQFLLATLLAAPLATGCFLAGLEPVLVKYGKVFSATQFLLSPDREHYLPQSDLLIRFALAYALSAVAIAILQFRTWNIWARKWPTPKHTRQQENSALA